MKYATAKRNKLGTTLVSSAFSALIGGGVLVSWSPLLSGCSSSNKEVVESDSLTQAKEELRRAQIQVEQDMGQEITLDRAKQLASTHLALKQARWGEPTATREDEEKYYFTYETPEKEMRLIGHRVLMVDKQTGVVTYQKRR